MHTVKICTAAAPFQASDISGGVVAAPLSQSQTRRALRSTLELPKALFVSGTKRGVFGWGARGVRAGRRGGSAAQVTKHFFKATLLLCNNLLLPLFFSLFLLQINSREKLKTPQLTMRRGEEGKKKKSSSWLEFNKSTSPSGLGLCT